MLCGGIRDIKTLLFDLDDTLYPEITYVKSGFKASTALLAKCTGVPAEEAYDHACHLLETQGRGHIFNDLLAMYDLDDPTLVDVMLLAYRTHSPAIKLWEHVHETLTAMIACDAMLGVVTDGMASVQHRKIEALGIAPLFHYVLCTDEIGPDAWKPSPRPFLAALTYLDATPDQAIYVGDNPTKDFKAPNQLGMMSVRIRLPNTAHGLCSPKEQHDRAQVECVSWKTLAKWLLDWTREERK